MLQLVTQRKLVVFLVLVSNSSGAERVCSDSPLPCEARPLQGSLRSRHEAVHADVNTDYNEVVDALKTINI